MSRVCPPFDNCAKLKYMPQCATFQVSPEFKKLHLIQNSLHNKIKIILILTEKLFSTIIEPFSIRRRFPCSAHRPRPPTTGPCSARWGTPCPRAPPSPRGSSCSPPRTTRTSPSPTTSSSSPPTAPTRRNWERHRYCYRERSSETARDMISRFFCETALC